MYEVELKVEITAAEREQVLSKLLKYGFLDMGSVQQVDCYIEAIKSPHSGYDIKRYRNEDGKLIYTKKVWEMQDGEMIRNEEEREATKEEFDKSLQSSVDPITIRKDRQVFDGLYNDVRVHVDMDTVKFDHSPDFRYFIETEILTTNKEEVKNIREFIRVFLKELLNKAEIIEAPGMFTMAFEKK